MKKINIVLLCCAFLLTGCFRSPEVVEDKRCPNTRNRFYNESVYECFEVDLVKVADSIEEVSISANMRGLYQLEDGIYSIYSGYERESHQYFDSDMTLFNLEMYHQKMSENQDKLEAGDWLFFDGKGSSVGMKSYLFQKDGKYYQIRYHLVEKRLLDPIFKEAHVGKDLEAEYQIKLWMDYDDYLSEEDKEMIIAEIWAEVADREPRIKGYIDALNIEWEEDINKVTPYFVTKSLSSNTPNVYYSVVITIEYDGRMSLYVRK